MGLPAHRGLQGPIQGLIGWGCGLGLMAGRWVEGAQVDTADEVVASVEDELVRAVRVGVTLQALVMLALVVYALVGAPVERVGLFWGAVGAGVAVNVVVPLIPWREVAARGWKQPALVVWSLSAIALIGILVLSTGGSHSPLLVLFMLTTAFYAVFYEPDRQGPLLAVTVVVLVGASMAVPPVGWGQVLIAALSVVGLHLIIRLLSTSLADEQALRRQATDLSELKSQFIEIASHELRTPLTVAYGVVDLLHKRWDELEEATRRRLLERAAHNARALVHVVETLLDFSRLGAGRMVVDAGRADLAELVAWVVDRLEPRLSGHNVTLSVPRHAWAQADPRLLDRVVENLLVNAVTHTHAQTEITVAVRSGGREVTVEVTDTGAGMDPDVVARLGTPFFRTGRSNVHGNRGLGLGLAICRQILQAHGSKLEIRSRPQSGSTLRFALPASSPPPQKRRPVALQTSQPTT